MDTGFWFFIFLFISAACLIPFGFSFFYIFLGIRNYLTGKKENSRQKIIGGTNTIAYAVLGMIVTFFIWLLLCKTFLSWEI
jgi:hypothetical protein